MVGIFYGAALLSGPENESHTCDGHYQPPQAVSHSPGHVIVLDCAPKLKTPCGIMLSGRCCISMVVHFMAGPPPTLFHQGLFHVDMFGSNAAWASFTCAVLQGLWEQDIIAL